MHEKCPTPAVLHVCMSGVNHALQFASPARAREEYAKIAKAMDDLNGLIAQDASSRGLHLIEDDYGTTVELRIEQIGSLRVTDIVAEHRAAQQLELAKFYVALDFQENVDKDHPALKLMRAKAPNGGSGLIRPQ